MRAQSQLKGQSPSPARASGSCSTESVAEFQVRLFCLGRLDSSIRPTSDTPCVDLVCVQNLRVGFVHRDPL